MKNNQRVIISLTSWKKRIDNVDKVIKTLKEQTVIPDKIVLYLAETEFDKGQIPKKLSDMCDELFEIRWTKNIGPYKKLIPALRDFPDDVIITVDDDIYYDKCLVELLINGYEKYPNCIQAHRVTTIKYYADDRIETILDSKETFNRPSRLYKLTGVGGVLYPPNSLQDTVFDEKAFLALAPAGDDIWFWVHGLANGYKVNLVDGHCTTLHYIEGSQDVGLSQKNDVGGSESPFFEQFRAVVNQYPEVKAMLKKETRRAGGLKKIKSFLKNGRR